MSESVVKMILAGLLFGVWPLLMSRSGLMGTTSTAVFTAVVLLFVMPFALKGGMNFAGANWWYAISAGCVGAIGLLAFNGALAQAKPQEVGRLFVVMIVVQTAVPALYHAVMNGELTLKTGAGFAAAVLAAFLLV